MAFSNSYTHDQLNANFSVTNAAGTADAGISAGGAPSGGWGTATTNTPSGGGGATGPSAPDAGESGYIYFEASGTSAVDVIDFKPDAVFDNTIQNITITIRTNLNYDTNSHIIPEYTTVASPTENDWHSLSLIDGTSTDTWVSIVLDLSQANGVRKSSTLKYRLRFETNGVFSNDFAISTVDEVGVDATILDTPIESLITTDNLFEENFALTDRSGASQAELSQNSGGLWCYSTSGTGTGGTGPSAPPVGYAGFVFAETSGSTASDTWALTRSKIFDNTADGDLKVFVKHNKNAIATGNMLFQYATVASPTEPDWTTLTTIAMNATDAWVDDEFDLSVAEIGSQSTIRYRIKLDLPESFAADWAIAEAREVIYPAAGGGGATDYALTCDAGSFSIAGQDADLVYTAGATNYTLTCDAGSFAITGQDAALNYSAGATAYTLDCEAGSFTIAGQDAALNYTEGAENFTLDCEAGAFTITGQDATLNIGSLATNYTLTCEAGAFLIGGQDADLTYTEGAENFTLECEAGAFVIDGQDAELVYVSNAPVNYTLVCEAGSFNIDGQDASLLLNGVDQNEGSHGFETSGSSFRHGRRVPLPFQTTETRKSKRLRRKLEKVEKERAKVKKLIADTSKSKAKDKATQAAIDKSRVYEALLTQQANELNEKLIALVGSFEQQAHDELAAYQVRKQQAEIEAAKEQFILEDIARKQAAESDDMIFIMAMLAAA